MASKNAGTQPASAQEKAFSEMAANRMADYRTRWLPAQQRLSEVMTNMGKPDSSERQELRGKAVADTGIKFDKAADQVRATGENRGIGASSTAAKLATTGMGSDEAASKGIAVDNSNQTVDNAYFSGLTQLMSLGRGQAGHALTGMAQMSQLGERQAGQDAEESASTRAGYYNLAGQGIGFAGKYGSGGQKAAPTSAPGDMALGDQQAGGISTSSYGSGMNAPGGSFDTAPMKDIYGIGGFK